MEEVIEEIWKDVVGYEGAYQISNLGRVRSLDRKVNCCHNSQRLHKGKIIIPFRSRPGYLRIELGTKKPRKHFVHRLIAKAFINNPENLPFINHKDGNKLNNDVSNLEWCDSLHNNRHAVTTGLNKVFGENNNKSKLRDRDIVRIRELYSNRLFNQTELAKKYNVDPSLISQIVLGKIWKHIKNAPLLKSGEINFKRKFTAEQVTSIRDEYKECLSYINLAKKHGVSDYCITCIIKRKTYKDIP